MLPGRPGAPRAKSDRRFHRELSAALRGDLIELIQMMQIVPGGEFEQF